MKILRFLGILILVLVVIVLVLGLVMPKDVVVTRSTSINAPKDVVFNQVVNFKNWPNWSPWLEKDPNTQLEYSGTDGQAGSGYKWKGGKETGEGEMTASAVKDGEMDYDLHFIKPMEGKSTGSFIVADSGGMSKVTWTMNMHMSFPMNAMGIFFNPDKMVGKDFERGLERMKTYCEAHAAEGAMPAGIDIKEADYPGATYAGIRKTVKWEDMSKFFMDSYGMLGKEAGARISGPAVGIYYKWDTVNHQADMAAAFPVSGTDPVKGATMMSIAPSKAYMSVHTGGYSASGAVHEAMGKHLADNNKQMSLVIEEYIKGPGEEKDSSKYVTNIWYLVK